MVKMGKAKRSGIESISIVSIKHVWCDVVAYLHDEVAIQWIACEQFRGFFVVVQRREVQQRTSEFLRSGPTTHHVGSIIEIIDVQ